MDKAGQNRRIDYIEFRTTDMAATQRFYGGVFGWTFQDYGPGYAGFNDGRLDGGFELAERVQRGGPLVIIYASDLAAMEQQVREAGSTITREIYEFPGGRRFHFTDPSGNELAVWSDVSP